MYKALKKDLKKIRETVNIQIDRFLPRKDEYPKNIHKAIRHSLFAGGKGIRSYLLVKIYSIFKDDLDTVLPLAAALEMLHTYTLIHDDLPYLDNDDFRRGKPTCHKLFGDDIALLSGDTLLIYAFDIVSQMEISEKLKAEILQKMTKMAGAQGLVGGQWEDINCQGKKVDKQMLSYIHKNKTAGFIELTATLACMLAQVSQEDRELLEEFAGNVGLSFQIVDDILDIEGTFQERGKSIGKDQEAQKVTYPALYGLQESKNQVEQMMQRAKEILTKYHDKALMLQRFTDYLYLSKW